MSENNKCCIKLFAKQPNATRSGNIYGPTKSHCEPCQNIFGSILNAIPDDVPYKARTISRKAKVLCLCRDCSEPKKVFSLINNRSGVICVQIQNQQTYVPAKSTGIQTDVFHEKTKLFCDFRKSVGVREPRKTVVPSSCKLKNENCQSAIELKQLKCPQKKFFYQKRTHKYKKKRCSFKRLKLIQKQVFIRKAVKKRCMLNLVNHQQRNKGKSLLKYVLKKEAVKKLEAICSSDSSSEDLRKLCHKINKNKVLHAKLLKKQKRFKKLLYSNKYKHQAKIYVSNQHLQVPSVKEYGKKCHRKKKFTKILKKFIKKHFPNN